ncbi:hypothetical protein CR983_03695 [Candidatus Saccharibacteria bacterium]|nr:MAG: hypothetical protein CR983_03695 [Candidatus Saccharibacteria bacterium]
MATPARTTKSAASAKPARPRKKMSPLTIIGLVLLACGLVWLAINGGAIIERYRMTWYLEKKYGEEFVVSRPVRKANGIGVKGHMEAEAYPKGDPDLVFSVTHSPRLITDEYAGAVWSREETARLKPVITDAFGGGVKYSVEIKTTGTMQGPLPLKGRIPNFSDGADTYGKKIFYILRLKGTEVPNDTERLMIARKILGIKNSLPLDKVDMTVGYSVRYSEAGEDYVFGTSVSGEELAVIRDPKQIVDNFKKARTY